MCTQDYDLYLPVIAPPWLRHTETDRQTDRQTESFRPFIPLAQPELKRS